MLEMTGSGKHWGHSSTSRLLVRNHGRILLSSVHQIEDLLRNFPRMVDDSPVINDPEFGRENFLEQSVHRVRQLGGQDLCLEPFGRATVNAVARPDGRHSDRDRQMRLTCPCVPEKQRDPILRDKRETREPLDGLLVNRRIEREVKSLDTLFPPESLLP